MAFRFASLFLFLCLSLTTAAQTRGPVVEDASPQTVSINSVLHLHGYRLYPSSPTKAKIYFLQNGNTYVARSGGGSSVANDEHNGRQTLEVIVPEEVVPGPSQVVVEVDGLRTAPVTVTIVEWKLPDLKSISPTRGSPGTSVHVVCIGFHIYDEIELTDAAGKVTRFESGGSRDSTGFVVPKDAAEGPMMIRIGSRKYGNQFTEPVKFLVTNDPLPLEVMSGSMTAIAAGQWLTLHTHSQPLKLSELTEVAFKQAGQTIIVCTPNPHRPHVAVPTALSPGDVAIQTRTWHHGRPSVWSTEASFRIAESAVPPSVEGIRLENSSWVDLWPGPDRPKSFNAKAGDRIVLNGSFRAVDASKLKISLIGLSGSIELDVSELDPKAEWFGEIIFKLPETVARGNWRMLVVNKDDGTQFELPIVIRII